MTESRATSAVVRRVLPAPPEIVFDTWLDAGALAEFMCPDPGKAAEVECDPRIGGRLRIVMAYPDSVSEETGEYLDLDRPIRLSFSWKSDVTGDSVVMVDLEPHGERQTLMTITHTRLPELLVDAHHEGWSSIANHLAALLQ